MDVTVVDSWGRHHFWRDARALITPTKYLQVWINRVDGSSRLVSSYGPEDWNCYLVTQRREVP